MQPFDIVDILDEAPEIGLELLMGLVVLQVQFLPLSLVKRLSALALSYGLPVADMLMAVPASAKRSVEASLAGCTP